MNNTTVPTLTDTKKETDIQDSLIQRQSKPTVKGWETPEGRISYGPFAPDALENESQLPLVLPSPEVNEKINTPIPKYIRESFASEGSLTFGSEISPKPDLQVFQEAMQDVELDPSKPQQQDTNTTDQTQLLTTAQNTSLLQVALKGTFDLNPQQTQPLIDSPVNIATGVATDILDKVSHNAKDTVKDVASSIGKDLGQDLLLNQIMGLNQQPKEDNPQNPKDVEAKNKRQEVINFIKQNTGRAESLAGAQEMLQKGEKQKDDERYGMAGHAKADIAQAVGVNPTVDEKFIETKNTRSFFNLKQIWQKIKDVAKAAFNALTQTGSHKEGPQVDLKQSTLGEKSGGSTHILSAAG